MKQVLRSVLCAALVIFAGNFTSYATPCGTVLTPKVVNTSDCGASDGSLEFTGVISGTAYTVTYLYNAVPQGPFTITPSSTTLLITGLASGDYDNIVITDPIAGCTWGPFGILTVYDPVPFIDSVWSVDPPTCGTASGSIFLSDFTPSATYTINDILNGNPQAPITATADANGVISLNTMSSGSHDITVSHGTCTSNSVNIILYDPVFSSNFDYTIHLGCNGDTVVFENASVNTTNVSWDFGDNTTSTDMNPTHVYATQGVYTVVLHAINGSCDKTTTHEITLVHPVISSFTMSRDSICLRQQVTLDGTSSTNAYSYSWDFGDGKADRTNNPRPTHIYTAPGTYTISLTVSDFVPCENTSTRTITIAPFTLTFTNPDSSVCIYEPMKIRSEMDAPGYVGPITYTWSPVAGLLDTNIQEPRFYAADTQYHVYTVIATTPPPYNCYFKDTVRIFAQPHVHLVNVTPSRTVTYGSPVHLNADGGFYYTWSPGIDLDNANIKDPIAVPSEPTTYTVYAMNEYGGCRDSAVVKIDMVNDQEYIPSAFTPNMDGKNDLFKITNMRSQRLLEMRVYNRWGQLLFKTTDPSQGWDGNYNGQAMDSGVYSYIIRVGLPDGSQKTYRGDVTLLR